ncbi:MAG: hypothetical protein ACOCTK_01810 [Candidatus Saliniplasma sp.]
MLKLIERGYVKTLIIFAISLLVISSSGSMIQEVQASAEEVPTWLEGDYWHYNRTEDDNVVPYRTEVVSTDENIKIDDRIFECYRLNYTWMGDGKPEVESHFYTRDGLSVVVEASNDGLYAYNPTLKQFDFPLEGGKTWDTVAIRWEEPEDNEETWVEGPKIELEYTVEGRFTVEVPAGTFDTYLINMTKYENGPEHIHNYYSPEVKNMVKREEYYNGKLIGSENLTDYGLEERNEEDDDTPFLSTGVVVLLLASSAVVYYIRDKFKEKHYR